jgi:beta-fructofuranosidase
VVMVSPLIGTQGRPLAFDRVAWLAGDLRVEDGALRFEPVTGGRFDVGPDLYAPQVLALQNRVLTWGWIWEDGRSQEEVDAAGWAGVLSFPRELHVVHGRLESAPAPELTALRRRLVRDGPGDDGGVAVHDQAFEVVLGPRARAVPVGVRLFLGARGAGDGADRRLVAEFAVPDGAGLRALVDGSVIEVFVDGEPNRSSRAYPAAGEGWVVEVGGVGVPADAEHLSVWTLGLPTT